MPDTQRIRQTCPSCGITMQLPIGMAHRPAKCPKCGTPFPILDGLHASARPLAAYELWPPLWQGVAAGALSGLFLLGLVAIVGAIKILVR